MRVSDTAPRRVHRDLLEQIDDRRADIEEPELPAAASTPELTPELLADIERHEAQRRARRGEAPSPPRAVRYEYCPLRERAERRRAERAEQAAPVAPARLRARIEASLEGGER